MLNTHQTNLFYASNVFLNLRDVVSCQSTDLSFLLAVFFNFVYLLLINLITPV